MGLIQKTKLANGIYWLDFPKADLRILCGCPADAVKHMMKRGVIMPNEASTVFCESGPNAILLSDLAVQKGSFANLAEFPVLQMLYRQGMILPDHPGNTGVKPLLMGHHEQLQAQLEYIHRGNYGLLNEREIIEAGASPEQAKDFMRLKLKFAFGKIAESEDLLDSLEIENDLVEIRNGVTVQRKGVNLFEFNFEGETVNIDLNLKANEQYTPPYRLGQYQVKREYFSIVHSGEGDGWDIERPSMASIISFQGKIYLIDVGPNIETSLHALGIDISEVEGIFLTHAHDDHFAGLPSLIRSDHRIKFFATPLVRKATIKKLSGLISLDESRFDQFFESFDLKEGKWTNIEGLEVKPEVSPHPLETTVLFFRTQWGSGYKSYAHLADIASFDVLNGMITEDHDAPGISADYFEQVKSTYLTPCDLKKVDNGGGLIHGMAKDFEDDRSDKIIFAHTARALNEDERKVGSGAPFGTEDILIPSNHDFLFARAYVYLLSFFPDLPQDQFKLLLNHEVVKFNPEEIILRDGEAISHAYFILTGSAEMLDPKTDTAHRMSSGSFIGDMHGLYDVKSTETYRAVSFLKALKLPIDMYKEFVKRNDTFQTISLLGEKRELLQKSWLFGGSISDGIKNAIAASMHIVQDIKLLSTYENISNYIGLIKEGTVKLKLGDRVVKTLGSGDALFEEHGVYGMESIFTAEFSENAAIALIPLRSVKEVPIVQWKLLENVSRIMRDLSDSHDWSQSTLEWQNSYSIGIPEMDESHKLLLNATSNVVGVLEAEHINSDELQQTIEDLIEHTKAHFDREQRLFRTGGYSEADDHCKKHAELLEQLLELRSLPTRKITKSDVLQTVKFLKWWILLHIMMEDRKYASYLIQSGQA